MSSTRHILWSSKSPYGPFFCEREDWKTCKDHKELSLHRPDLPAANIEAKEPESTAPTLSDYADATKDRAERRYALDPRDTAASLAKAEKIIARANKKGLEGGFSVSIDESNGFPELVVKGEPFSIDGWHFVASIEHLPNGEAIIKKAPTYEGEPIDTEIFEEGTLCQHCNLKRHRKVQVMVEKGDLRLIVGSTCLKDFLGWEFTPTLSLDMDEVDDEMRDMIGGGGFNTPMDDVLAIALAAKDVYGFIPASRSEDNISTKERVNNFITNPPHMKDPLIINALAANSYATEIAQIKETVRNETAAATDSDYLHNMKAAYTGDRVFHSTMGLVISGISMEERRLRKIAEAAAKPVVEQKIFAPVGTRVTVNVTCTAQSSFETQFGVTTIYTFIGEGHRFKWFSSSNVNIDTGDNVSLVGTVKDLETYNGEVSTLLTRCKVK